MTDLSMTISPKSDQMNSDDLIGRSMTIKVTDVKLLGGDQPIGINFEGDQGKPYKPCKSMRRVLVHVWGADGKAYIGKSMTLYRDAEVAFGGAKVGGIRISHMSGIDKAVTMALTVTRANRKPYTVQPLSVQQPQGQGAPVEGIAEEEMTDLKNAITNTDTDEELDAAKDKVKSALPRLNADQRKVMNAMIKRQREIIAAKNQPVDDDFMQEAAE